MPRVIAPRSGVALVMRRGQRLRVIDPEGEQVCDLLAFNRDDIGEALSSGRSLDYSSSLFLSTGDALYSNRSRPMWTIVEDTVGRHDFLLTPCSPDTFRIIYGTTGHHPSCFANLASALAPFGIAPDTIPTTLNVFMNVEVQPNGELRILPPRSRPGDHIVLRAEMDMIVGVTACSAELSNNGSFKPIDVELLSPEARLPAQREPHGAGEAPASV